MIKRTYFYSVKIYNGYKKRSFGGITTYTSWLPRPEFVYSQAKSTVAKAEKVELSSITMVNFHQI